MNRRRVTGSSRRRPRRSKRDDPTRRRRLRRVVLHHSDDFNMVSSWTVDLVLSRLGRNVFRLEVVLSGDGDPETPFSSRPIRTGKEFVAEIGRVDNYGGPSLA